MHNCCGNNYGRNYCPCCGRRLATVCPCCGGSYWGWHNCGPYIHQPVIIPPQPMWVQPQWTFSYNVAPAPGSAAFAQQRLAGAA